MQVVSPSLSGMPPEQLLSRALVQLRNHVLWDALLLFLPPLLACGYGAVYLWRNSWVGELTLVTLLISLVGFAIAAIFLRYRPLLPSLPSVAERIDRLSGAKDRFVTLATIETAACSTELLSRLRREAASLQGRIELRRDFPYRLKSSFYVSLAASLLAVALIHLVPAAYSIMRPVPVHERLRELAEKMAQRPNLKDVAHSLRALATQLVDPKVNPREQQTLIQEIQKQIEQAQQKQTAQDKNQGQEQQQQSKQDQDLLSDASATVKSLEQQSGSGQEQQKDQNGGGGSIQSNLPQDGKGESKPSSGGDGQGKGDVNAQMSQDMQQGKSSQGDSKGDTKDDAKGDAKNAGGEKNSQGKGDTKDNHPDPNQSGADKSNQTNAKNQSNGEEKGGKGHNTAEEIPQGAAPTDRMGQAGDGKGGLKNARYVTVQLPEDVAGDPSKGESSGNRDSKGGNRVGAKLPVSNSPLPAHLPDAPAEKQQMPLEYRGIIR